jgi:DnaA family protein
LPAAALDGLGDLDLVALDDLDAIAGDPEFERAVFGLFEQLRQTGGRLVVSAGAPPADVPFRLPDLASRLRSGGAFRVQPLDDAGRLLALKIRARFRGFDLPDETGRYLLNRTARGPASLFRILDTLDRAALVAQKRLTIPFVRRVLDV